mmetsp:Transcript_17680/g.52367  ORF Transcript_17680/g.52367 Transcript_17680/m.52367 type:complete len:253 (-) Transcript_17680:114-872(-)
MLTLTGRSPMTVPLNLSPSTASLCSVNSTNAKRDADVGSPEIRTKRTLPARPKTCSSMFSVTAGPRLPTYSVRRISSTLVGSTFRSAVGSAIATGTAVRANCIGGGGAPLTVAAAEAGSAGGGSTAGRTRPGIIGGIIMPSGGIAPGSPGTIIGTPGSITPGITADGMAPTPPGALGGASSRRSSLSRASPPSLAVAGCSPSGMLSAAETSMILSRKSWLFICSAILPCSGSAYCTYPSKVPGVPTPASSNV